MALSQLIWSLDDKAPLKPASLTSEMELEHLLVEHIELLNKSWMVIGKEVVTGFQKRIDILCMDHDGQLVVVELKKDKTPRDVVAQVLDYASWVNQLTLEEIAKIYLGNAKANQKFDEVYRAKFNCPLDEDSVNSGKVKMVIVASKMDDSTERIVHFLRDCYGIDINILFFDVYEYQGKRLLSRVWFEEDTEELPMPVSTEKGAWNKEYYVSFGADSNGRNWEDAQKYGFISAGGGDWYTKTLKQLSIGDRVWVNIPHTGYVGVGIVSETVQNAKSVTFTVDGQEKPISELQMMGNYLYSADEPENEEWMVKVEWLKKLRESEAVKELGFFGNQNTVCRPQSEKWNFTVERLKKLWNITD